jgi:glucokinase
MSGFADGVLLGDIGATNARFAFVKDSFIGPIRTFEVARFARFTDAVEFFLKEHPTRSQVRHAFFAIAAPIEGKRSSLTNCPWIIDTDELKQTFGIQSRLLNDFEAVAFSLPLLGSADLERVGGITAYKEAPMAVLGPGTGLGVACLVTRADKPVVIQSEGGHATSAGSCEREDQIIQHLRRRFGHASAERAISGPGLKNIYEALGALDKVETRLQSAEEITSSALRDECHLAVEALNIFCAFLGSFAGNVMLTFGARGDVYIAGGISPRIVDFMRRSQFRDRFEAKGRFREYLKSIPVDVIMHPGATFIGLNSLLSQGVARMPKGVSFQR